MTFATPEARAAGAKVSVPSAVIAGCTANNAGEYGNPSQRRSGLFVRAALVGPVVQFFVPGYPDNGRYGEIS